MADISSDSLPDLAVLIRGRRDPRPSRRQDRRRTDASARRCPRPPGSGLAGARRPVHQAGRSPLHRPTPNRGDPVRMPGTCGTRCAPSRRGRIGRCASSAWPRGRLREAWHAELDRGGGRPCGGTFGEPALRPIELFGRGLRASRRDRAPTFRPAGISLPLPGHIVPVRDPGEAGRSGSHLSRRTDRDRARRRCQDRGPGSERRDPAGCPRKRGSRRARHSRPAPRPAGISGS